MTRIMVSMALASSAIVAMLLVDVLRVPRYTSVQEKVMDALERERLAGAVIPDDPLNGCGDPCVITGNNGGRQIVFLYAAKSLPKRRKYGAVIDGRCYSGCASFAAFARPNVCVTMRAAFYFHSSSYGDVPVLPADVRQYVFDHGGFPPYRNLDGSQRFTPMSYPDTLKFFKECGR